MSIHNDGNTVYRPVQDSNGNPVFDADAVALRDELLETLEHIRVPENPVDAIINAFGSEKVGEVTGRKRRFVQKRNEDGNLTVVEEKRGHHAARKDAEDFQADKKPILVFSQAGGTGYSFHADNTAANKRRRIHYILQPGWRADMAVQGFGRTHRTNQASAPYYVLPTTNLKAQKRFVSSIARRLDQLGALTRGQRQAAGSSGLFSAADNLENKYADDALDALFLDMYAGKTPLDFATITRVMGLNNLVDKKTGAINTSSLPEIPRFLNRLLSLQAHEQDAVFDEFEKRLEEIVHFAIQNGTYDNGLQTLKAASVVKVHDDVAHTDERTGAQTRYVEIDITNPVKYRPWEAAAVWAGHNKERFAGWFKDAKGHIFGLVDMGPRVTTSGQTVRRGMKFGVREGHNVYIDNVEDLKRGYRFVSGRKETVSTKVPSEQAPAEWTGQIAKSPTAETVRERMIVGVILPVWDRIKGHSHVVRVQTDEGERLIGRLMGKKDAAATLKALGLDSPVSKLSPGEILARLYAGERAILGNDWEISESTVSGEVRIEITPPSGYFEGGDKSILKDQGVFFERIQWKDRAFIPTGENAEAVLARVLVSKPVVDLIGKNAKADGSAPMASLRSTSEYIATQRRIGKFVDAYVAGQLRDSDTQVLGEAPEVLQRLGAPKLPLGITGAVIGKVLGKAGAGGKHGYAMSPEVVKAAVAQLYDPLMVFDSKTNPGAMVVLTEVADKAGDPVVVAVHMNRLHGRIYVNSIASIHGRTRGQEELEGWARDGLLRYYNKAKTLAATSTSRLQLPSVVQLAQGSGRTLLTERDVVNDGPMASRADALDDASFAADVLTELSAEDELFRYPVSKKSSLDGVFADTYPEAQYLGEETHPDELDASGADHVFLFKSQDGSSFRVFTRDAGEVWIDVSRFKEGEGGSAVYAAVANWAYNNRAKFIGDPKGLTDAAVERRTAAMLASALRFGTTRHLDASPEQIAGRPGIAPLDWQGDDAAKIGAMIRSLVATAQTKYPHIKGYRYDFSRRQFLDAAGKPVSLGRFVAGGQRARDAGLRAGQATLRRGVLLQSLVSSASGERPGILERVLRGSRQIVTQGGLKGLLSKGSSTAPSGETAASIRSALVERFGAKGIQALEDGGVLAILDSIEKAPAALNLRGDEEAVYDPKTGRAYLFADQLTAERAAPVLLHEIGEHYGLETMLGKKGWDALAAKVHAMSKVQGSIAAMVWEKTAEEYSGRFGDGDLAKDRGFLHEVIARLGEFGKVRSSSLWSDIVAAVKRFLLKMGIAGPINEYDVADLV